MACYSRACAAGDITLVQAWVSAGTAAGVAALSMIVFGRGLQSVQVLGLALACAGIFLIHRR